MRHRARFPADAVIRSAGLCNVKAGEKSVGTTQRTLLAMLWRDACEAGNGSPEDEAAYSCSPISRTSVSIPDSQRTWSMIA